MRIWRHLRDSEMVFVDPVLSTRGSPQWSVSGIFRRFLGAAFSEVRNSKQRTSSRKDHANG